MGEPGESAAAKLELTCEKLSAKGLGKGVDRLKQLDKYANVVDFPTLDRLVDPDRTIDEFAAKRTHRVHLLHSLRNVFAVVPLLVTWVALALASINYSKELARYPDRVNKPFLLLWQRHFGRGFPTFSSFGKFDLVLLFFVFVFTGWVYFEEYRLMRQENEIGELVDAAMADLAVAISSGLGRTPENAKELAESAEKIIQRAVNQTEALARAGREALEQASKDLLKVHTDEREFVKQFSGTMKQSVADMSKQYQQFMSNTTKMVREAIGQQMKVLFEQQMKPLLEKLESVVAEFEKHQAEFDKHQEAYRTGVTELTGGISTLSKSAEVLSESARDHAKVGIEISDNLAKVAKSQSDFADQVTLNVSSMDTSAKAMQSTAEVLRTDVMTGLNKLSGNVTAASGHLASVQGELATTTSALGDSTEALRASSTALATVSSDMQAAAADLSHSLRRIGRRWFFGRRRDATA